MFDQNHDDESKFVGEAATILKSSCQTCVHRWASLSQCNAFTDRIPEAILDGENKHMEPVEGDHGIQYEAVPKEVTPQERLDGLRK